MQNIIIVLRIFYFMPSTPPTSAEFSQPSPSTPDFIACLCAVWCGTCRDYQERFEAMQTIYPQAQLLWVDIEDMADVVDPVDLENFPTLLIAKAGELRFYGVVTPQKETLERLLAAKLEASSPALHHAEAEQLLQRLSKYHIK